ncbi:B1 bradykinin receptor [Plakobranchus ocellatus]|uniref:B1 bradykinin receptor n=1 Tax=Plakobranchus ocellatus TaxID=259542 RepID=A0AAV3Y1S2_9GAST|nr:B1 bradykinin receptor [Plakobranchus ocellatus]
MTNDSNQVAHENLNHFSDWYARYHGYLSLCVCISGIVTNTFNVTVLTRRHMRSPVNQILTGLAVSDIITMLSYVPFAIHFYCLYPSHVQNPEKNSRGWMSFFLFHINLTLATHTVSIWLCVLLAIVRYLHIKSPTRASSVRLRRITHTRYMVFGTYILPPLVMIPNYLTNELKAQPWPDPSAEGYQENASAESAASSHGGHVGNQTIYVLENLRLGTNDTNPLVLTNVWMYAILAKLVPCALMFVFGSLLLHQMRVKINQRKDFLKVSASNNHKLHEHSRTTKMLITVIVLFLITELPQGVLIVLSACKSGFFLTVYMPLGDVMDIGALVNNAINFALYCSMSCKFRQTFLQLYCGCLCGRKHSRDNSQGATPNGGGAGTVGQGRKNGNMLTINGRLHDEDDEEDDDDEDAIDCIMNKQVDEHADPDYSVNAELSTAPIHNKVISGFQVLRQARAPVAGLELTTERSLADLRAD